MKKGKKKAKGRMVDLSSNTKLIICGTIMEDIS